MKSILKVAILTGVLVLAPAAFAQSPADAGATKQDPRPATVVATQLNPCLIVTSAEGHRMRNAIVAGVFTGGIGLATGLLASGGRYEYRDSVHLPPADQKTKYKGKEILALQKSGVHVVVIRKNPKGGGEAEEVKTALESCKLN